MVDETRQDDRKNQHDHRSDDEDVDEDSDHDPDGDHGGDGDHDHGDGGHGHDHDHDRGHDHHHHDVENPGAAVVTVSTSRSFGDDPSGDAAVEGLEDAGFELATRELVNDDFDTIQHIVDRLAARDDTDLVVTTGGTGVTPDDLTVEAVQPLIGKTLPGFGELFRTLSYDEVGTRVVGTRAIAGIVDGVPVFCLPGSENAVRLGVEEIIVEEAPHLIGLATRDE
jgi:molybdenum cofactor biosynthesis protein B